MLIPTKRGVLGVTVNSILVYNFIQTLLNPAKAYASIRDR